MSSYAIVGMSHIEALGRGWKKVEGDFPEVKFIHYNLRRFKHGISEGEALKFTYPASQAEMERIREEWGQALAAGPGQPAKGGSYIDDSSIARACGEVLDGRDAVVFNIEGNEHNIIGLVDIYGLDEALRIVRNGVRKGLEHWLKLLQPLCMSQTSILPPPPPVQSEAKIMTAPDRAFQEKLKKYPIRNAVDRLRIWQEQCNETRLVAQECGIRFIDLPGSVFSPDGFMAEDCSGADATHGNELYGDRVMRHVIAQLQAENEIETKRKLAKSTTHPYAGLPEYAYWRQAVSDVPAEAVDPVVKPRFQIALEDKVATAGSCFAQHISKRLRAGGFNYFLAEPALGQAQAEQRGFYDFSARYGNIYTARQLLQLFDRAFGYYMPLERVWTRLDGAFCDPFRPRIEPEGYASPEAVLQDAARHLEAVRRMFVEMDVFVFTLGLTECWLSKLDGAAFPVAPGVAAGIFSSEKHAFVNFGVAEVVADMKAFLGKLKIVNPGARVLLTVSPVPLVATQEDQHVLVSTIYSKSVLRVAAEQITSSYENVQYFPSYEIITGPHSQGGYFGPDRRSITDSGVDHVMRVFMSTMTASGNPASAGTEARLKDEAIREMQSVMETGCDEEMYARPSQ